MTAVEQARGLDVNLRSGPQMLEYVAIADRIARDRPGRILDWGCGWGQVSALLAQRGLDVSSFDYRGDAASEGLEPLEKFPEITAYVSSEPVRLPYEDDQFDAVLSCGVLEHVQQPDASLDELHRVLRPGGTLYVYKLPNRLSWLEALARVLGMYYHGKLPDDRVYTKRSAVELIERHGFTVGEARRFNMLPLTLSHPFFSRHAERVWRANAALSAVPGLELLGTNVEVIARSR